MHAVIGALDVGPVEMFASSGGAVTALALVAAYPNDVTRPGSARAAPRDGASGRGSRAAAWPRFPGRYAARGWGAGMAAFIAMTSWQGEFTEEYFARSHTGSRPDSGYRPRTTAPEMIRCSLTVPRGHQLSPRFRCAGSGADPHRDRCGRRVSRILHRTHVGGHSRTTWPGSDGLSQPSWRLRGRRLSIRRQARSVRTHVAQGPGIWPW